MHALSWFEIPASNLERSFVFYNAVFPKGVRMGTFGDSELILFNVPFSSGEAVGGSIVCRPGFEPSANGPVIFLTATGPINETVARIGPAGGKVLVPEMNLGKFGFAALFLDSEGNRLGVLSAHA